MSNHLHKHLLGVLEQLEKAQAFIRKTQPFGKDERRLRMLTEIIKEQLGNEDTRSSARQIR